MADRAEPQTPTRLSRQGPPPAHEERPPASLTGGWCYLSEEDWHARFRHLPADPSTSGSGDDAGATATELALYAEGRRSAREVALIEELRKAREERELQRSACKEEQGKGDNKGRREEA